MINSMKKALVNLVAMPILVKEVATKKIDRRELMTISLSSMALVSGIILQNNFQKTYAEQPSFKEQSSQIYNYHRSFEMTERENEQVREVFEEPMHGIEEDKNIYEINNAGEIGFGEGSDVLDLARLLVGEAESYWNWKNDKKSREYLEFVASTVITRMNDWECDLKDVVYDVHKNERAVSNGGYAYDFSCFNPFSNNYEKVVDPLNNGVREEVWKSLYEFSELALNNGAWHEVDHYLTNSQAWETKPIKVIDKTKFYRLGKKGKSRLYAPHIRNNF